MSLIQKVFAAQAVIEFFVPLTSYGSKDSNGARYGMSMWSEFDDLAGMAVCSEDNVGTSNSQERQSDKLCLYEDDGTLLAVADTYEATANGYKRNFSTAPASAFKGFALAIGGGTVAGGASSGPALMMGAPH